MKEKKKETQADESREMPSYSGIQKLNRREFMGSLTAAGLGIGIGGAAGLALKIRELSAQVLGADESEASSLAKKLQDGEYFLETVASSASKPTVDGVIFRCCGKRFEAANVGETKNIHVRCNVCGTDYVVARGQKTGGKHIKKLTLEHQAPEEIAYIDYINTDYVDYMDTYQNYQDYSNYINYQDYIDYKNYINYLDYWDTYNDAP